MKTPSALNLFGHVAISVAIILGFVRNDKQNLQADQSDAAQDQR